MEIGYVEAIFRYPVKSMAGERLDRQANRTRPNIRREVRTRKIEVTISIDARPRN